MIRLTSYFFSLRESFWFLPAVMSSLAIVLHLLVEVIDEQVGQPWTGWLFSGGPDGAREILSVIAASTITVAGVVFSITMVTLSIASSQFGPRLIRSFMRDTGTQVVFGTMMATFLFSLLSMRHVRSGDDPFVPVGSLWVAVILVIASVGMLIYFIHHIAASVQAESLVARVGRDLQQTIERRGSSQRRDGQQNDQQDARELHGRVFEEGAQVSSARTGFIQGIDYRTLTELAASTGCVFALKARPGTFIAVGSHVLNVLPPENATEELAEDVRRSILVGSHRTLAQDIRFGFEELIDIAVRALSPGVNVPFLAAICVNHIGAALGRILEGSEPDGTWLDDGGEVRVLTDEPRFSELVDVAFGEVRRHGAGSVPVVRSFYEAITRIAPHVRDEENRQALLKQAYLMNEASVRQLQSEIDRQFVARLFSEGVMSLNPAASERSQKTA